MADSSITTSYGRMENMQYAEELVREFLVFRGFTSTLQVFETELSTDIGKAFQVDKIMDLIFSVYVPKFQAEKLVGLMRFLRQCLTSASDSVLIDTLSKLVISILRYYIVHALQSGRQDKVVEFFEQNGNDLMQRAVPYLNNPSLDPQFRVYFSREWFDMLLLSVRNFLSEIFSGIQIDGLIFATGVFVHASSKETVQTLPASVFNMFLEKIALGIDPQSCHALGPRIPALLKLSTEKNTIKHLNKDIKQLTNQVSQLQALLEAKEAQLCQLRSLAPSGIGASILQRNSCMQDPSTGNPPKDVFEENNLPSRDFHGSTAVSASHQGVTELGLQVWDIPGPARDSPGSSLSESEHNSGSLGDSRASDTTSIFRKGLDSESSMDVQREEEFPEVNVEFQETFLGHTSPISRCRFSAAGTNIASASVDGTVRIWTYDSSTSTARNATLYCGAEIMSLDWECKSGRLLLIGTADGGIKAWNADAKRVVCDLTTTPAFPSVLDLKCSPVEPIFVSAAASRGHGSSNIYEMGYASLTVWNMKTWKAMTALPLGKDPPAITSICFNHNGKILAASATDGMIHMFDISAGLQITGWPAHDTAVSSVQFGPDETSIFSLGSDGKIFEWSLQNQGQVLWSRDCSRFCHSESMKIPRHEMALDSNGRSLLVTSNSVRSPIYQVQSNTSGLRTLPHSGAITTVDWHPTMPIFLTGSVDHSVRVTSIS